MSDNTPDAVAGAEMPAEIEALFYDVDDYHDSLALWCRHCLREKGKHGAACFVPQVEQAIRAHLPGHLPDAGKMVADPDAERVAARIAEIRERCDESTPGPWIIGEHASEVVAPCPCCGLIATCALYGFETGDKAFDAKRHYNSGFIAHAREDIPWLLDQLDASAEECERWKNTARHHKTLRDLYRERCTNQVHRIATLERELRNVKQANSDLAAAHDECGDLLKAAEAERDGLKAKLQAVVNMDCINNATRNWLIEGTDLEVTDGDE